jgi:voltage-gated potassium channel
MDRRSLLQARLGFSFLGLTLLVGTAGYMIIESWAFLDAIYMTVITVTTTGFNEVHGLSESGRVFTLLLIVMGVFSIAYTVGGAAQAFFETLIFGRRSMSKKLEKLINHFIVCGFGKMGKFTCEELWEREALFVVIEKDPTKIEIIRERGYLFVHGDATRDDILVSAGIGQARGLVVVLSSDADNVFTTLSAKTLCPKLFIVSRAVEEETEPKLLKAGATRVVKPYEAAGTKMAELLLRPGVIEFIDLVASDKTVDLNIEEVLVRDRSLLVNKTLGDSSIRQTLNIIIVAINKPDGTFIFNPTSPSTIEAGDRLMALGERKSLIELNRLCSAPDQQDGY